MFVALTGTPGTGKTSVSHLLQQQKLTIISLNDIAQTHGFFTGIDKQRDSKILAIDKINAYLHQHYTDNDLVIIEGHASHHLPIIHKCIVLRCHPQLLKQRLQVKQWKTEKIQENIEAEILDIILSEAVESLPDVSIFEINTSHMSAQSVAKAIQTIISHEFRPIKQYTIGTIDWSEEILDD